MLQSKLEVDKNNEVVVVVNLSVSRHKHLIWFLGTCWSCGFFCVMNLVYIWVQIG